LVGWGDVVRLSWGGEVRTAHQVATYDEIGAGAIGLVLDSYGLLAVALMRRSAAGELGLGPGDEVTLSAPSEGRDVGITVPVALRGPGRPPG
jgi:S-adenosylmethionine hydrolase